jgi:hypothetical protein
MLKFASFLCLILIIACCLSCSSSEETITSLPYDPPGATITTDKEIFPQYYRTISFNTTGIFVSNEFEGARLNDFYQVNESTYTAVVLPENAPINDSPWYSFKIWSIKEQNINLIITYKDGTHRYKPKISYDGKHWELYDSTKVSVDTTNNIATLDLKLKTDTLWISAQEVVTSKVYKNWLDKLSQSDFVSYTVAGKSSLGKPIYKMTIRENENSDYLFIIGRNHPPEVTGFFGLKSFVETIAGESEIASEFRKKVTTVVIPLVNPDGVDKGHWRHNINGVDLNRDWIQFNQPEPRVVRNEVEKILSNPENKVIFFIDFHSTTEDIFYTFSLESLMNDDLSEGRNNRRKNGYNFINQWLQNLQEKLPEYHVNIIDSLSKSTSPTSDRWIMREYDVPGFTYEVGDETYRKLIKRVAQTAAEEFMKKAPSLTPLKREIK